MCIFYIYIYMNWVGKNRLLITFYAENNWYASQMYHNMLM